MSSSAPLRIVFAGVGSRGDVQPMVALAQQANARGHHAVVAAPINFAAWVRSCGVDFAPCGIDFQKYLEDNPAALTGGTLQLMSAMREAMHEQTQGQLDDLMAACRGADALVSAGLAVTAPTVAQAARIPHVNVLYSSCWIRSSQHPPPIIHRYGWPAWANRMAWSINDALGALMLGRVLNPLRTALGLSRCNNQRMVFWDGCHAIAADGHVFPSDPEWNPHQFPRANFIYFDDARPLDPELDAWLRDGPAPVFAGFGSMSGRGPQRATRAFIDAMAGSGRRCVVGAGWSGIDDQHLPPGWRIVGDVPHAQLFPRVAVVIHHGGSGTTATALRAGAPQVILPLLLDQYHHAHLLHRAGLAPRPVPMESVTAQLLAQSIDAALQMPEAPRHEVAERLRASDGGGTILDIVERQVTTSRPCMSS